MKKILVPVDGSDQSAIAARWAGLRAQETGGAVTLLHIYDMPAEDAMGLAPLPKEEVVTLTQSHGEPSFASARNAMEQSAVIDDSVVVVGHAAEEIVSYARLHGYDHIVMGSRGHSLLRELVLGSVSESVLHHAPCAVTVVR